MLDTRLLYRQLESDNQVLENEVRVRTDKLYQSERRLQSFKEPAPDWYWEQYDSGHSTQVSGPAMGLIGMDMPTFLGEPDADSAFGWIDAERKLLQAKIASRQSFVDFFFSRIEPDGSEQHFRVSGEPMFSDSGRFTGYRGIGSSLQRSDPSALAA